jgi:hypothetical protein
MLLTKRLLTTNCHEAWIYQLGVLGVELDIIDQLPGRYTEVWDTRMRPLPPRSRLFTLESVLAGHRRYGCAIAHNISDLLDLKTLHVPKLLVLHTTLEHRAHSEAIPLGFTERIQAYLREVGGHVVATSELKRRSWGLDADIVPFGLPLNSYLPWSGEIACGLRVANQISAKRETLRWDFHLAAFSDLPVRLVGHNPDMPGVEAAASWDHLKELLRSHRFFIHTADPAMEDGYNMATIEAMAAGLPVLGNPHPSSPIEHGVDGFLSDHPAELENYARILLADRDLAGRMGARGKEKAAKKYSEALFGERFSRSIECAQRAFESRPKR